MNNPAECGVVEQYFERRDDSSFTRLYQTFVPQLIAFFRRRGQSAAASEDLAQETMLAVHLHAGSLRDRTLFRPWLFRIARNANYRMLVKLGRDRVVVSSTYQGIPDTRHATDGIAAFEFKAWLAILEPREQDLMTLRYVEDWEYHEIAAAQSIPIGTIQWRVFNSKKKLAAHLRQAK
jgi:RNA polymerase sigma-70 factor, ECF subfamily